MLTGSNQIILKVETLKLSKIQNSAPFRKAKTFAKKIPKTYKWITSNDSDYLEFPPIIVNSLPKSGTHLLMQLADALPNTCNFGTFIAQTPSLTLKERTQSQINDRIAKLTPGEVVGAHIYYSPETAAALKQKNALHLFIWRDPRDVILSEAHYLAKMAKFHAMHSVFKKIEKIQDQIEFALRGEGTSRYPDAHARIAPYLSWNEDPNTVVMRYEKLSNPGTQESEVSRIVDAFSQKSAAEQIPSTLIPNLITAIAPEKSHTFHKGGIARWRNEMDESNQELAKQILGKLIEIAEAEVFNQKVET